MGMGSHEDLPPPPLPPPGSPLPAGKASSIPAGPQEPEKGSSSTALEIRTLFLHGAIPLFAVGDGTWPQWRHCTGGEA